MANEREQTLQAADQYAAAGDYPAALAQYESHLSLEPQDVRVLLKRGDVQARAGDYTGTVTTYQYVAQIYLSQAEAHKAAAVYRQVWELARRHPAAASAAENYEAAIDNLVRLFAGGGMLNDALTLLDEEATVLRDSGREEAAIALFRKMTVVAPNIPLSHLRLAEALCRTNVVDEAMGSFDAAARLLQSAGRPDDALRVIERMLHFKQDPAYAKIAAKIYLAKGGEAEGMQALSRLQICFQADSKDLETLQLLSQTFEALGQGEKAIEVRKELARQAHEQGRPEIFQEVLRHLKEHAPHDEQIHALTELPPPPSSEAAQAAAEAPLAEPVAVEAPAPQAPPMPQAAPSLQEAAGLVERRGPPPLPANAFGAPGPLAPPTAAALPATAGGDPTTSSDPTAGSDPRTGSAQAARVDVAPSAPEAVSDEPSAARPPPEPAPIPVRSAAPPPRAPGRAAANRTAPPPPPPRRAAPEPDEFDLMDLDEPAVIPQVSQQVQAPPPSDILNHTRAALVDARTFAGLKLYDKAIERLQIALEYDPRSIELRELLRDVYAETGDREGAIEEMLTTAAIYLEYDHPEHARTVLMNVLEAEPDHALAKRTLAQLGGAGPAGAQRLPQFETNASASPPAVATTRRSVEDTLEQVEVLLLGDEEEQARQLLMDQLTLNPGHPLLLEALEELNGTDDSAIFDLRASLNALERAVRESQIPPAPGAPPSSKVNVDRVFEKFKAKVQSQVADNDAGTHHDLGVAYKEMGLLPDAINEFQLASRDPKRACACHSMIGHIYIELGDWTAAAESFEQGLSVAEQTPAQSLSLNYDLGVVYAAQGDTGRAREQFELVVEADPNYRDAQRRLTELGGARSGRNGGGDDDLDRAFEDLIGPE